MDENMVTEVLVVGFHEDRRVVLGTAKLDKDILQKKMHLEQAEDHELIEIVATNFKFQKE